MLLASVFVGLGIVVRVVVWGVVGTGTGAGVAVTWHWVVSLA